MSIGHFSATIDSNLITIVSTLLDKDRRMTEWEVEGASGILKTMIHCILTKHLMKTKVAVWWVLHMVFPMQKHHHMELCQKHLICYEKEGIAHWQRIISIGETCKV